MQVGKGLVELLSGFDAEKNLLRKRSAALTEQWRSEELFDK